MEITKGNVKVCWVELGEGFNGDYDPEDPDDIELLRFDVMHLVDGEWLYVESASYCTLFPVQADADLKAQALAILMDRFYEPVTQGISIKKLAEEMSWIEPNWLDQYIPPINKDGLVHTGVK